MSSGGDEQQTTTSTSGPPEWAIPYFQQLGSRAMNVADQQWSGYGGDRVAGFTPEQMTGLQMGTDRALGPSYTQAAGNELNATLAGGRANPYASARNPYASQNAYLDSMVNAASEDVVRNYQTAIAPSIATQFAKGGAFGGSAMNEQLANSQRELAGQLGRVSTNLRYQDFNDQRGLEEQYLQRAGGAYEAERGRQYGAIGMAPGLDQAGYMGANWLMGAGAQQQGLNQAQLDNFNNDFYESRDWGASRLGLLGNALASIQGGTTSQTGANPNYRSGWQNAAGIGLALYGMGG